MENKLSLEGLIFQATKINVENNVLTITLNRPEKKNALNNVMMNEICYALSYAKQERENLGNILKRASPHGPCTTMLSSA